MSMRAISAVFPVLTNRGKAKGIDDFMKKGRCKMKWLNSDRKRIVLMGCITTLLLSSNLAKADFILGPPTNLGPIVNISDTDVQPTISSDGLSLYFQSKRPGGHGKHDLWVTTRATTLEPWGEARNLEPPLNSPYVDGSPYISCDGLELYFGSDRPSEAGGAGIYVSTRATSEDAWGEPVELGPALAGIGRISITADGLELYGSAWNRPGGNGGHDIWVSRRISKEEPWGEPVVLPSPPNTSGREMHPEISPDGLALFFESVGQSGNRNIFVSTRVTKEDPWGPAVNLGPTLESTFVVETMPSLWTEGLELYFSRNHQSGTFAFDLCKASIIPIVDLNADGIVDAEDMCIIVDNWGTDNKLCDIGPMPWGDGIVNVEDLIVLANHLFEEFPPVDSGQ